ncbi:hypothetical protein AZE42_07437 [Rhizopogon vesiculosus]|uniref:Uncharacterized protein n=1 Tax=Rhizopogon vesiculosus TaxID=180088 RepID=A0A1J8PH96_9AGAM|nr:hypothetical protein AZE42_07437 [Rhizopogon vesiculosus]
MTEKEWDIVMAVHLRVRESDLAYFPKAEIRSDCCDPLANWYLRQLWPDELKAFLPGFVVRVLMTTNLIFDSQGCHYWSH